MTAAGPKGPWEHGSNGSRTIEKELNPSVLCFPLSVLDAALGQDAFLVGVLYLAHFGHCVGELNQ
jgi:hypothetical protein